MRRQSWHCGRKNAATAPSSSRLLWKSSPGRKISTSLRENDEIAAAALAVPVTLKGRSGSYLYGLCGQGSLLLAGLVDYLCAQQKLRGAGFTVAVPAGQEQAALLENKGFQRAFALRCLPREVSRNLWSQAEFDSVTARKLCELRERFYPDTVQFPPEQMAVVLTRPLRPGRDHRVQREGLRHLLPPGGHPLFCGADGRRRPLCRGADGSGPGEGSHRGARRHHSGCGSEPFLGEGTRQDYGMIRFDAEPFDVEESYMRLMMES